MKERGGDGCVKERVVFFCFCVPTQKKGWRRGGEGGGGKRMCERRGKYLYI